MPRTDGVWTGVDYPIPPRNYVDGARRTPLSVPTRMTVHFPAHSLTLGCGLLDATAILNTSSFGIGAYVAASALAAHVR